MITISAVTVKITFLFSLALIGYYTACRLNRRKLYPLFLICLLAASAYVVYSAKNEKPAEMTVEEKAQILREYPVFSDWYTSYKKDLDKMDANWQQYHKLIKAFSNDEIGIETLHTRLVELKLKTGEFKNKYAELKPPEPLTSANCALVAAIIEKTRTYTAAQDRAVTQSADATAPENLTAARHHEQTKLLEKIMVMNAPDNLNIAQEVLEIRDNLTIQNAR